mgnify:CR=1 FL=1|jgi:hypothetical protein
MADTKALDAAAAQVFELIAEAIAEVSAGQALNQVASASLRSSLEDAILQIDSEAFGASTVLSAGVGPSPLTGSLPSRANSGKLQRIRELRAALFGITDASGRAVGALDVLLQAATVE